MKSLEGVAGDLSVAHHLEYRSCNPGVGGSKLSAYPVSLVAASRTWLNCCFWPSCFSPSFFGVLSQLCKESNNWVSGVAISGVIREVAV